MYLDLCPCGGLPTEASIVMLLCILLSDRQSSVMLLCSRTRTSRASDACSGQATPQPIRTANVFVWAPSTLALAQRRLLLSRIVQPATNKSHIMDQLRSSQTRTAGVFRTASHYGNLLFVQLQFIVYGQNSVSTTRNVPQARAKKTRTQEHVVARSASSKVKERSSGLPGLIWLRPSISNAVRHQMDGF